MREALLKAGRITQSTMNNEERVLKRFLRHVREIEHRYVAVSSSVAITQGQAHLETGLPSHSTVSNYAPIPFLPLSPFLPFATPMPLVASFFLTLSSDGARATAKSVIKQFLAFENPEFETSELDYLTQTEHHSKHPLIELWIESRVSNPANQVNHRYHLKRLVNFIAQNFFGKLLHELDMQDDLTAYKAFICSKVIVPHFAETTVTGLLVTRGQELAIEFIKEHSVNISKQTLSILNQFLKFLKDRSDPQNLAAPPGGAYTLTDVAFSRRPVTLVSKPSTDVTAASNGALQSDKTEGLVPPVAEPAPSKARRVIRPADTPEISTKKQKRERTRPDISRVSEAFIERTEEAFIKKAKAYVVEGHHALHGVGYELQITLAMRDLLLVSVFRAIQTGFQMSSLAKNIAKMKFSEVICRGPDAGIYLLNDNYDYSHTLLPDSLAVEIQLYRRQLGGCRLFDKYLKDASDDPNLFFSMSFRNPLTHIPITAEEVQRIIDTELEA